MIGTAEVVEGLENHRFTRASLARAHSAGCLSSGTHNKLHSHRTISPETIGYVNCKKYILPKPSVMGITLRSVSIHMTST